MVTQLATSHNSDTWPSRADKLLLHEAATKKRKTVTFTNGKKFTVKYDKQQSIAWGGGDGYDVVFITPADGSLVPCGWFHIHFLLAHGDN